MSRLQRGGTPPVSTTWARTLSPRQDAPTTFGASRDGSATFGPDQFPPTYADVVAAAARLHGEARRTPVLTASEIDHTAGASVFVKADNLQTTGSAKFRGAYNKVSSLEPELLRRGVIAFSSGNHGCAVAHAAALRGVSATVFLPIDAPVVKRERVANSGAAIKYYDPRAEDREGLAAAHARATGAVIIAPCDDPVVIAGNATAAAELLEDVQLDTIVVPVGGGGLVAGAGIAAGALAPSARIVGVEPVGADDTKRSFESGHRVVIPVADTVADGLRHRTPGRLTLPMNYATLEQVVLVSDEEIVHAMRMLFDCLKIVAEPSGATALAAVLFRKISGSARIGVIVSGGNIDTQTFCRLCGDQRK